MRNFQHCFIDESIHESVETIVTAFIFTDSDFPDEVKKALKESGIDTPKEEFKSSYRMDNNKSMQNARSKLLGLASEKAKIAVFIGPYNRNRLGLHSLQALQSVLIRNSIDPSNLSIHYDEGILKSKKDIGRIIGLFHYLKGCDIYSEEDSRTCLGIQVADAIAHSFGQIIKESLTGTTKMIEVGGPNTGYKKGTKAPLGRSLLMDFRHALLTRPVICDGEDYSPLSDPIILDPENDDPVEYMQNPTLLGWGIKFAPEANSDLRQLLEKDFGQIWLGCMH